MKGQITVHMTPDLWIPKNGQSFPIVIDIDARVDKDGNLTGTYLAHRPDIHEPTLEGMRFGEPGQITSHNNPEADLVIPPPAPCWWIYIAP